MYPGNDRILSASSILDYVFRELAISYLGKEELAHTPSIASSKNIVQEKADDKFLNIVKNITSKGFVRSNLEEKFVDLSDVRINLKSKKLIFFNIKFYAKLFQFIFSTLEGAFIMRS